MDVNYYQKSTNRPLLSKIETTNRVLLLDYLDYFISNSSTKRVKGYGTVGLAYNTIRTYKSLYRIISIYEKVKNKKLYINIIDKYTVESLTRFLKFKQQYSDNYCGQLLKLLKITLRDAEKSGLEVHPYSNYIESFKQKSSDRILHVLSPFEIELLKELKGIPHDLIDSYKWLLIGLSIGQRVSDVLELTPKNIRKATTGLYIDIIQKKTKKAVTIGVVDPVIIKLLEYEFPKKVSQVIFNNQIKLVCKLAEIN